MVYFLLPNSKRNAIATVARGVNSHFGIRLQLCLPLINESINGINSIVLTISYFRLEAPELFINLVLTVIYQ